MDARYKKIMDYLKEHGIESEYRTERKEPYINIGDVRHIKNRMQFWVLENSEEVDLYVGKEMGNWYRVSSESAYCQQNYRYNDKENKLCFPNVSTALSFIENNIVR